MRKMVSWVTVLICLGKVLFAMANNAQGVLLTSYIDAFGLTSGMQGLPNAAANAGVLVAMLLSVPMASRMGKLTLHALGMGLIGLMLALAGAASSAAWLVMAYVAMGFGFGCVDTTSSAAVADLHPGKRGALMMGVLHAAYGTGGILAPLWMTAALGAGTSWRTVLLIVACAVAVLVLVDGLVFPRARRALPQGVAASERVSLPALRAFLARPGNLLLVACAVGYCAHQCSVYLWISRIIGVGYGDPSLGALALSLFWVGTVISRLAVPLTGIGTVRYMRAGMVATAAVQVVSLLIGGGLAACVGTALAGLLGGASLPMLLSEANARNPNQSMLAVTSILLSTACAAMVCAPLIGFIVGKTTLTAGIAVAAAFALCSALAAFRLRPVAE